MDTNQPVDRALTECSITTPPRVEDGAVVFVVLHEPSEEAFLCKMDSFDDVNLTLFPDGLTPIAEGEVRGIVAEAALRYARQNEAHFGEMFNAAHGVISP